jgi:hypothetical protein
MTVAEAIAFVRTLLDEPKYEYFGTSTDLNSVFIDALRQAAAQVTRDCWNRGEKEAIRTLWREVQLTLGINQNAAMPEDYMFIESVVSNYRDPLAKRWPHKYVSPAVFNRRRNRTPFENVSGVSYDGGTKFFTRSEYTLIGSDIYATATGSGKSITVSYIAVPVVPTTPLSSSMPLAEYIHPMICEKAAEIMYRKEHPGDDRAVLGSIYDIESALYNVMRGVKQ